MSWICFKLAVLLFALLADIFKGIYHIREFPYSGPIAFQSILEIIKVSNPLHSFFVQARQILMLMLYRCTCVLCRTIPIALLVYIYLNLTTGILPWFEDAFSSIV